MADKEEVVETPPKGNDWEVVSLTASEYAAAPGLEDFKTSMDKSSGENEAETSNPMFMSGHFFFPPSQHENLPLEPEHCDTQNEKEEEGTHDTITSHDHESDSGSQSPVEGGKYDEDDLPREAWWKRRALSLYSQVKEANTIWSVFIAAAVMGLVIIGRQWQQERSKVLLLRCQFGVSEERMARILGPISRLKDVIVGGHRRGSLVRESTAREH